MAKTDNRGVGWRGGDKEGPQGWAMGRPWTAAYTWPGSKTNNKRQTTHSEESVQGSTADLNTDEELSVAGGAVEVPPSRDPR